MATNKAKTPKKPDVLTYYCVTVEHWNDDCKIERGYFHFATKDALFAACAAWLEQGEAVKICEDSIDFSDGIFSGAKGTPVV